jgi:uncharacterized membrane protein
MSNVSQSDFRESHARSILKGFSWRIIASITTILVAYWVTGETHTALKVGGIEFFGKIGIYYLHERAWQAIPRGHVRHWFRRESP